MLLFEARWYWRTVVAAYQVFGLRAACTFAVRRLCYQLLTRATLALDRIFIPGLSGVEVRRPVFLIGHPRSGTTFLHRLLTQTNEFCVFQTWEIFVPSLVLRRIVRPLIVRLVAKGKGEFLPKSSGHQGALKEIEEEELLFFHNWNTQFMSCLTPLAFSDHDFGELVFADDQPARLQRSTMAHLKRCFQRQIYQTGKPQLVTKMNYSAMRVRALLAAFPDAKFIYIHRSPLETIPSHLTLHRNLFDRLFDMQRVPQERLQRYYQRRYQHNLAFYQYMHELIEQKVLPPDRFMLLNYADLLQDLTGVVQRVVEFAGLQLSPELQELIEAQSKQQTSYRREHENLDLDEFGLTQARISKDFHFALNKG